MTFRNVQLYLHCQGLLHYVLILFFVVLKAPGTEGYFGWTAALIKSYSFCLIAKAKALDIIIIKFNYFQCVSYS